MGFFDALWDITDIAKDIVTLPVKIVGAAIECATDINEAVAQDVKNKMGGTPDMPIRTSYDIRDDANRIIESANKKYYKGKSRLTSSWDSASQEARCVSQKRAEVYQLLGQATSTTLLKLPEQPVEIAYPSDAPYIDSSFDIGTYFGLLGINARMDAAEEYLQEAEEYRANVNSLINDINLLRQTVLNVSYAQKEELAILDTIQAAYCTRNREVLAQSADLLHEIAALFVKEMSSNTERSYNNLLRHLKSLWA